jgi:capsular exopolysaccharide synthesis family protein
LHGFHRYYEPLREHWWLVVACVVVTLGAAAAYVKTSPNKYRAQAELLISPAPATDSTLFGLPVLHASGDPTRDVLTAASLVTTTQVANAAIAKLHLQTSAGQLLAQIQANPIGQSNLIGVQASASSPATARTLANAFAQQMIAVRTAAVHASIANIIPGLETQVAALPPGQRNGPGTLGDTLSQLQELQRGNDPTLAIASPAELPAGPYSPRTKLALAAGLLAGLLLGVGGAFAWTALDPRVKREEQLRRLISAPVLAKIPRVRTKPKARPLTPEELPLAALEGYRTLRTILAVRAEGEPQAYLVTGSGPSEGKTTTAMGLALALAQGGARVVLIEADLRRPTISVALGLTPEYGTDQVLIGEVPLEDALIPVRIDGTPIRILASNRSGVELADRLSFAVARRLIEDAKRHADFVVIDSPPMTTVIDALPLVQFADEILVVVRLGQTRLNKLIELDELFRAHGTYATGLVLVGGDTSESYGYYYSDDQPAAAAASPRRPANGGEPTRRRSGSSRPS